MQPINIFGRISTIPQPRSITDYRSLAVTLNFKTAKQFFCMTLCLMIIHHHTKIGHKKLISSGDIALTKNSDTGTQTEGHTDAVIPIYTLPNFVTVGYNNRVLIYLHSKQRYPVRNPL